MITHQAQPWRAVRAGLSGTARSSAPITSESMRAFYSRQGGRTEDAVADVVSSARLEGLGVSDAHVATLEAVRAGRLRIDDAVAAVVASVRR